LLTYYKECIKYEMTLVHFYEKRNLLSIKYFIRHDNQ